MYSLKRHVLSDDIRPASPSWVRMNCVVCTWHLGAISDDLANTVSEHGASARNIWLPSSPGCSGTAPYELCTPIKNPAPSPKATCMSSTTIAASSAWLKIFRTSACPFLARRRSSISFASSANPTPPSAFIFAKETSFPHSYRSGTTSASRSSPWPRHLQPQPSPPQAPADLVAPSRLPQHPPDRTRHPPVGHRDLLGAAPALPQVCLVCVSWLLSPP